MAEYRVEKDTMGEMKVPAAALYGAQTQRAVENFPISGQPLPAEFIHALGYLKMAAAAVNLELGLLDTRRATAIAKCAGPPQWAAPYESGWLVSPRRGRLPGGPVQSHAQVGDGSRSTARPTTSR